MKDVLPFDYYFFRGIGKKVIWVKLHYRNDFSRPSFLSILAGFRGIVEQHYLFLILERFEDVMRATRRRQFFFGS